jgi:hypothetical protein
MITRYISICAVAVVAATSLHGTSAYALSMQECSAKYKAAKEANTLNGMKWNDFRKAQCGAKATAAPQPVPAPAAPAPAAKTNTPRFQSRSLVATQYFPVPFHPSIRVNLQAKRAEKPA